MGEEEAGQPTQIRVSSPILMSSTKDESLSQSADGQGAESTLESAGRTASDLVLISRSMRSRSILLKRASFSLTARSDEMAVSDRSFVWIRLAICVRRLA